MADGFLEKEIPTRQHAVPIRKEMESYEVRKTGLLVSTDQLFILSVWTSCYKMFPYSGMGGGQANTSCAGLRGLLPSVGDKNHTDLSLHRTFAFRVVEKKINVSITEGTGKSGSYGMWNHPRGHVWNVFVRPASS